MMQRCRPRKYLRRRNRYTVTVSVYPPKRTSVNTSVPGHYPLGKAFDCMQSDIDLFPLNLFYTCYAAFGRLL